MTRRISREFPLIAITISFSRLQHCSNVAAPHLLFLAWRVVSPCLSLNSPGAQWPVFISIPPFFEKRERENHYTNTSFSNLAEESPHSRRSIHPPHNSLFLSPLYRHRSAKRSNKPKPDFSGNLRRASRGGRRGPS